MRLVNVETFISATITAVANSMSRTVRIVRNTLALGSDQKREYSSLSPALVFILAIQSERQGMSGESEPSAKGTNCGDLLPAALCMRLQDGRVIFICLGCLGYINPLLYGRFAQFSSPNWS